MKNLFITALLALSVISCSKNENDDTENQMPLDLISVSSDGVTKALVDNICPILGVTAPLTEDEIEFLYAVREDEKVTKDITSKFLTQYPASTQFTNILAAEATHISAIEMLLIYYEITFPALGTAGVFVDTERQARYNNVVAQGTTLVAAYRAAATLEEECVAAYTNVLPTITNANIKLIIGNMLKASSNHLKAYVRQITTLNETYIPRVLYQAAFDAIIGASFGQGGKHSQQGGGGKGHGNTNSGKGGHGQGGKGQVDGNGDCSRTPVGGGGNSNGGNGGAGKGYRGGK